MVKTVTLAATELFDVVIVGAGPIGASLALALADKNLRIALLEAQAIDQPPPSFDERSIALAYSSRRILADIGLWDSNLQVTPIKTIHVSERGLPMSVRMAARDYRIEALGYVVVANRLGRVIDERLAVADGSALTMFRPDRLTAVRQADGAVELQTASKRRLRARLLVAADGAQSPVRKQLEIPAERVDFRQFALTANVKTEIAHQNCAYERFTASGPIAMLPLSDHRCALIASWPEQQRVAISALDSVRLSALLQRRFGERLGQFQRIGETTIYPLARVSVHLPDEGIDRVVFVGNAANTLHPVAGQGFNLGLRDVAVLARLIGATADKGGDVGAASLTRNFQSLRAGDQRTTAWVTDTLVQVFGYQWAPVRIGRALALAGMEFLPPLKHRFARQMMGLTSLPYSLPSPFSQ